MPDFVLQLMRRALLRQLMFCFTRKAEKGAMVSLPSSTRQTLEQQLDALDDVGCVLFFRSFTTPFIQAIKDDLKATLNRGAKLADSLYSIEGTILKKWPGSPRNAQGQVITSVIHRKSLAPNVRFTRIRYPTISWRGRLVETFSMTDLLGDEGIEELRTKVREVEQQFVRKIWDGENAVVLKHDWLTLGARMAAVRLQGYLADDRE